MRLKCDNVEAKRGNISVSSSAFSVTKIAERPDSRRFIFQKG